MRRLLLLGLILVQPSPANASEPPILGTMPAYPGATRPLRHFETANTAIAMTRDKPEAVIVYYMDRLTRAGWQPVDGIEAEAHAAALAGEPVWLTFYRPGQGRLDIQLTRGRHPKTQELLTLIMYQAQLKL